MDLTGPYLVYRNGEFVAEFNTAENANRFCNMFYTQKGLLISFCVALALHKGRKKCKQEP